MSNYMIKRVILFLLLGGTTSFVYFSPIRAVGAKLQIPTTIINAYIFYRMFFRGKIKKFIINVLLMALLIGIGYLYFSGSLNNIIFKVKGFFAIAYY